MLPQFLHPNYLSSRTAINWIFSTLSALLVIGCAPTVHSLDQVCSTSNDRCETGTFCQSSGPNCSDEGTCVTVPQMCTKIYSPVCGCDGKNYGNKCTAKASGVSVKHAGNCAGDKKAENSSECRSNADCESNNYCTFPKGDCGGSEIGKCVTRPEVCTFQYSPVCGCDGKTYGNRCDAASQGVSLKRIGECS